MTAPITPGSAPTPTSDALSGPLWPRQPSPWRTLPVGILAALVFLLTTALIVSIVTRPDATTTSISPGDGGGAATTTTTPARGFMELTANDIAIEVVVTEQHCFGSAGCNVKFEPELSIIRPINLEPGSQWDIIFRVDGAEDPYIGTIRATAGATMTDMRYAADAALIQTANSSDTLTATITSVRKR